MLNLLSNAIKFTPSEAASIWRCVAWMDARCVRCGEPPAAARATRHHAAPGALGRVRDTGVGIAAEDYEKIFQAFQQVDASYARRQEGTGLGFGLTRKLVRLLGGDIWFVSQVGQGSTFWFFVPYEFNDDGEGTATEREMDFPTDG
jgi:signal transduction histidine kinase